ncbi:hypothetical protein [Tenacibaculum soleae]|uniref:AbiU2 domain-containing protein n=1 Tax=Tenacibaculum soleae TaxID=447689 RepID=UPI0026E232C5|nr:hypothetical protein [Tenacibaculum soleae]MDO6812084.1 hypothetical protein [Tenacibaculum soleae]
MKNPNSIFKEKMSETYKLLVELEILKSDIQHLSNTEKEYFKITVDKSKFLYRTYFNSVKLLVLNIHKILNPKEYFSLKKTINFAKSNIHKIEWNNQMTQAELNQIELQINDLIEHNLEKIKTLRNNQYAHLDKNKDTIEYDLRLIDMYETIEKSETIYKKILSHFKSSDALFNIWKNPPDEIINLSKYHKIRKLLLDKYLKNEWSDDLDQIWKILNENPA